MRARNITLLIMFFYCCFLGCSSVTAGDDMKSVIWKGDALYDAKMATFKVSLSDALKRLEEHSKYTKVRPMYGDPVLIGEEYFFPVNIPKNGPFALQGYYVSGETGEVRYYESSEKIDRNDKWIKKKSMR